MENSCKYLFKILTLGDANVGKSCLLHRFASKRFTGQYMSTVGAEFMVRHIEITGNVVSLQIWDTAGEERFRGITSSYYRGVHGILLVYDTTDMRSFRNLRYWLQQIAQYAHENVTVVLVGNKCDQWDQRKVTRGAAQKFAASRGIQFVEASAKSGINVDEAFFMIATDIYDRLVINAKESICTINSHINIGNRSDDERENSQSCC